MASRPISAPRTTPHLGSAVPMGDTHSKGAKAKNATSRTNPSQNSDQVEAPNDEGKERNPALAEGINEHSHEIPMDDESSASCSKNERAGKFTCFQKLPAELRLRVWELAIPHGQTIRLKHIVLGEGSRSFKLLSDQFPSTLHVTRESRAVTLKLCTYHIDAIRPFSRYF